MTLSLSVSMTPPRYKSATEIRQAMRGTLRIFDRYYRARVAQRFAAQGPGWAARKDDGQGAAVGRDARAAALAQHKVKRKLITQLRRAQRRYLKGPGSYASVQRRAKVIEAFAEQVEGQQTPVQKNDRRFHKSVSKLSERVTREEQRASRQILGRLPNAMKSQMQGFTLIVRNLAKFSKLQNDGGQAGHGADIPARPFNYFDSMDGEVLVEVAENMMMVAAQ